MKCPYACNSETVEQLTQEHDENGYLTFQQTKSISKRQYVNCLREDCGAWQDGRCNYNQGANGA